VPTPFESTYRNHWRSFMADLFDNPMGLMGFEFVEFASPMPNLL